MAQYTFFTQRGDQIVEGLKCSNCKLAEQTKLVTNCMSYAGASDPTYLFCGVNPGQEDDSIGEPMTGKNGRMLMELLYEAGYEHREVAVTNGTRCAIYDGDVQDRHWKACKDHLVKEIQKLKPDVVVAVGAKAVKWLTGYSGVERLSRVRLTLDWDENVPVYSVRQPMALQHVRGDDRTRLRQSMVSDFAWLRSQVKHKLHLKKWQDTCDYKTARTLEDLEAFFQEIEAQPLLSVDLETEGLIHDLGKPLAIGFSWGQGIGRSIPLYARGLRSYYWWPDGVVENVIIPRIQKILTTKKVFGQNFVQFDQKWIREHFKIWRCDVPFDTQTAHYIINPEAAHDLESIAMEYLNVPPWKKEFDPNDTEKMCIYMAKDVDMAWRVRIALLGRMDNQQLWLLSELLIPLGHELMEMEWLGVAISEADLDKLDGMLTKGLTEARRAFRQFQEVQAFEFQQGQEINLDSPKQISKLFLEYFRLPAVTITGDGGYSTDKEWQEHYKDHPGVQALQVHRRLAKLKGTYCDGLRDKARRNRIHTSFRPDRTKTGRLASKEPNLQNIPRKDTAGKVLKEDPNAIKKIFAADPGYVLLQGDLSQAELRVLASVSGDPNMIDIYLKGLDLHAATAATAYGIAIDDVSEAQRNGAKKINFGIPYGMSDETLIAEFVSVGNTQKQAEDFLATHKKVFAGVWAWMAEQVRIITTRRFQRTFFGRTKFFPVLDDEAIRQAYNFPIQSLASDITEIAIVRLAHEIRARGLDANLLLTVHDSIIVRCRENIFWEVADLMRATMTGVNFPWMKVPMGVDIEAGYTWGAMKKLDVPNRHLFVKPSKTAAV